MARHIEFDENQLAIMEKIVGDYPGVFRDIRPKRSVPLIYHVSTEGTAHRLSEIRERMLSLANPLLKVISAHPEECDFVIKR